MPQGAAVPAAEALPGGPGWALPGVDPRRANVARVNDYLLGGRHNFYARSGLRPGPYRGRAERARSRARANRDFLGRAVRFLSGAVIRRIQAHARSRAYAERFFDGFDLVDPGRFWEPGRRRAQALTGTASAERPQAPLKHSK
jgi:hypothetical protein